ncbi:hypothetical protein SJAV_19300 [Sulfurisphaera javensis]|uniref:DUF308 domain-containing protein n=1 Tax=Sulfurisphaera javensis TaxID=2049879 RepID=A0AAT9GSS5_9CREN
MSRKKGVYNVGFKYISRGALFLFAFAVLFGLSSYINVLLVVSMLLTVLAGISFRQGFLRLSAGHKVGYLSSFLIIIGSPLIVLSYVFYPLFLVGYLILIAGLIGLSFEYYWIYSDYRVKRLNYASLFCSTAVVLLVLLGKLPFSLLFLLGQAIAIRSLRSI